MHVISSATESDVLAALAAGRDLASGSGPWTVRFIQQATRQFDQRWTAVELTGAEALSVIVPPHRGEPCRGDRLELVPAGGLSVNAAARALDGQRQAYVDGNRTCWSRIAQAMDDPAWSPVIVTRSPLALEDYATVADGGPNLYHLDGFHRLLGWALAGRLTGDVRLPAFLAG